MSESYIHIAYFVCGAIIAIEFFNHRHLYNIKDSVQTYLTLVFFTILFKYVFGLGFVILLEKLNPLTLIKWDWKMPMPWFVLIVGYDFIYYWMHRYEHKIKFLWNSSHVHHHSSRYLNFFTGFRSSFLQPFYLPLFVFPLFILGFNGQEVMWAIITNKLYNFWAHQQHIKKAPILDKFLNTPSNHRVHHGRNPIYIDKNFGGIFIIWDKLFGTYQAETEPVQFGIQKDPGNLSLIDYLKIGF